MAKEKLLEVDHTEVAKRAIAKSKQFKPGLDHSSPQACYEQGYKDGLLGGIVVAQEYINLGLEDKIHDLIEQQNIPDSVEDLKASHKKLTEALQEIRDSRSIRIIWHIAAKALGISVFEEKGE